MTWLACLIVVLGIGMAFGCCCDGVCMDCSSGEIEGKSITLTISGVTGTAPCVTECPAMWNGAFVLTYYSGAGTASCTWQYLDTTYDSGGVCSGLGLGRNFVVIVGSNGIINAAYYRNGSGNKAEFSYDYGGAIPCDFSESLSLDSNPESDGDCDHTAAAADVATV